MVAEQSSHPDEARHSRLLYHVLDLLVTGRALDKLQRSGEGEGAAAWRAMHEQREPRSRSGFTGMLLSLLSYRFAGDAQAAIDAFQRYVLRGTPGNLEVMGSSVRRHWLLGPAICRREMARSGMQYDKCDCSFGMMGGPSCSLLRCGSL